MAHPLLIIYHIMNYIHNNNILYILYSIIYVVVSTNRVYESTKHVVEMKLLSKSRQYG